MHTCTHAKHACQTCQQAQLRNADIPTSNLDMTNGTHAQHLLAKHNRRIRRNIVGELAAGPPQYGKLHMPHYEGRALELNVQGGHHTLKIVRHSWRHGDDIRELGTSHTSCSPAHVRGIRASCMSLCWAETGAQCVSRSTTTTNKASHDRQ